MAAPKNNETCEMKSGDEIDLTREIRDPFAIFEEEAVRVPVPEAQPLGSLEEFEEKFLSGASVSTKASARDVQSEQTGSATFDVEATLQSRPRRKIRNVLTKMQDEAQNMGPMSILYRAVRDSRRVKVWTRSHTRVRGVLTAYVLAYDRHLNLALSDVDEVAMLPRRIKTPIYKIVQATPKGDLPGGTRGPEQKTTTSSEPQGTESGPHTPPGTPPESSDDEDNVRPRRRESPGRRTSHTERHQERDPGCRTRPRSTRRQSRTTCSTDSPEADIKPSSVSGRAEDPSSPHPTRRHGKERVGTQCSKDQLASVNATGQKIPAEHVEPDGRKANVYSEQLRVHESGSEKASYTPPGTPPSRKGIVLRHTSQAPDESVRCTQPGSWSPALPEQQELETKEPLTTDGDQRIEEALQHLRLHGAPSGDTTRKKLTADDVKIPVQVRHRKKEKSEDLVPWQRHVNQLFLRGNNVVSVALLPV
ncbi:uncharacterized protein LOC135396029 [Ornithodoros turicata]|uniref:uncharacterized protein LOC135396029 n=1 Tax=Ornithodoros turicata TaxID=34597 RepID=UPI003139BE55